MWQLRYTLLWLCCLVPFCSVFIVSLLCLLSRNEGREIRNDMQQWSQWFLPSRFTPLSSSASNHTPSFIQCAEPWADCHYMCPWHHFHFMLSWYWGIMSEKGRTYISNVCSLMFQLDPVSGPVEGGTVVTISGSNLGQRAEDIQNSVQVAGVHCNVIHSRYEVSSRQVTVTTPEHNLLRNISVSIFISVTVFCINLVG